MAGREGPAAEIEEAVVGARSGRRVEDGQTAGARFPDAGATIPHQHAALHAGARGGLGEPGLEAIAGGDKVPPARREFLNGMQDVVAVDQDGARPPH